MKKVHSKVELTRKIKDAGYNKSFIETEDLQTEELVTGDLNFISLPSKFSIHYSDITENTCSHSIAEVDSSISINVLFNGSVSFALSNQRFDLQANDFPILFINIVNEKHIFTRYFVKNRQVKKLNITVSKHWLMSRCINEEQKQQIDTIFLQHQCVFQWQCSYDILALAKELFNKSAVKNNAYLWELEQLAFQIIGGSFLLLTDKVTTKNNVSKGEKIPLANKETYESKIDRLLYEPLTLDQIAFKLGASISTLQRYFKTRHQLTLKEYIRNQKLEHARRALIFDKLSVGEASYLAGYNHVSNFASAFKKYFSISPAALQNQYRK